MPRVYNDTTLARVCVRVWADDYEYLRKLSRSQGKLGLNLLIRQIIHNYVTHVRDDEQQNLNKLPDEDLPDIQIDLGNLEFEKAPTAPKGEIIDITL